MKPISHIAILLCGILFGAGLAWSGMIKPEVVLSFLRFQDMGLLLVLGSAVITTTLVFQLAPRLMKRPVLELHFSRHFSVGARDTIIGAALFGIGWGLSGVCPGPAIAGLGAGNWPLLICLAGMFAGAGVHGYWASRHNKTPAERSTTPKTTR